MSKLCDPDINMIVLTGCKTPEPSIRQMIYHWYDSNGMGSQQSKMFTDQYISEQDDICRAALDAMLAKAREDALREAAERLLGSIKREYGDHRDYRKAILAMIEKDKGSD